MESQFKSNPNFRNVYVKGEVSDMFISAYGHLYFNLKDKKSQVPCIVYKWFRRNLQFDIEDGMKLLVIANVVVYAPHGKYQLDVRSATEDGLGQLYVKYQQLKKKLEKEGLFDDKQKKDLPHFVKRIGVITSKGGSVIHDIVKTVNENWPFCQVFLFPAAVQGENSKTELVTQIARADNSDMDVLIVARGGGSIQDLWSYNEESVARAIFNAETPIISAIGHEDNTTLADLVSDKRASTPTMAASLAIEDKKNIMENINHSVDHPLPVDRDQRLRCGFRDRMHALALAGGHDDRPLYSIHGCLLLFSRSVPLHICNNPWRNGTGAVNTRRIPHPDSACTRTSCSKAARRLRYMHKFW